MTGYVLIKHLHLSFAILSVAGFALRGYWMLVQSNLLQRKATRVLPHINDSLLLITAIALVVMSRQYPLLVPWVTIKIGLLLLYIGFGSMALKRGATRQIRTVYLVAALLTVAAIFYVALTKPAW